VIILPNTFFDILDPLFETIGLISVSRNMDKIHSETIRVLNEMGIEGDKFYTEHMPVFDEYVQEFKKHYQPGDCDAFFFDGIDTELLLLILSLLLENRNHFNFIDQFEDSVLNAEIMEMICELYPIESDISKNEREDHMGFLEKCSFSDSEKWKLLQIMNSPKIRLKQLIASINANMAAYESAKSKVSSELNKLIEQYAVIARDEKTELFGKLKKSLSKTADVYPTLAFPISQLIFPSNCYYGLLSYLLVKQDVPDQNMILRSLKALGDASRLEILRLIKQKPMYNLEIAKQLGLTAATMSHHMGVLLACGFVGVTKQDSKVYYHLEEATARRFIDLLNQMLI
jgi:DNA-binding transcriptional ArsR family regulator